jgi:sugar O-acyltransferase (sialic acid O-acetyltransferase NeuD family)
MRKPLVIFGSAEIARLARFYFDNDSEYCVVAFTVDDSHVDAPEIDGLPLIAFGELSSKFPAGEAAMHVALSYRRLNKLRQEKFEQAKASGYELASYVCSKSVLWPDRRIGENCFILENQTIQPTVTIGNNVMIWSGNHLGHGSVIGDHTYIASHVVVSGHCKIGQRCFLGVNSTLRDFLNIGDDVFVGMQAAVVQDVASGSVVIGQSGEILPADDRRAKFLKQKYFGG